MRTKSLSTMQSQYKPLPICQMPYSNFDRLCKILDLNEDWTKLAGLLNLPTDKVLHYKLEKERVNGSPSKKMLHEWGIRNASVDILFSHLLRLDMLRAADTLRGLVPDALFEEANGTQFVAATGVDSCQRDVRGLPLPSPANFATLQGHSGVVRQSDSSHQNQLDAVPAATFNATTRRTDLSSSLLSDSENESYLQINDYQQLIGTDNSRISPPRRLEPVESVDVTPQSPVDCPVKKTLTVTASPTVAELPATVIHIDYRTVKSATKAFSTDRLIGDGTLGLVYRGNLSNTAVAIKVFQKAKESCKEFMAEILALHKFRHKNIIMLSGCSTDGPNICLIYEYMVNGSLKDRLECKDGTPVLPWQRRQSILKDAAAGLQYLHTVDSKPLVHGNLKSSNILLGSHFEAKIADFGLAKECTGGTTPGQLTHATVQHQANLYQLHAYLPKEFHMGNQKYSIATDVYSFGVVIYETCTGMKVYDPNRKNGELLSEFIQFAVENNSSNLYILQDGRCFDWPRSLWRQVMSFGQQCTAYKQKDRPSATDIHLRLEKLITESYCSAPMNGEQGSDDSMGQQQQREDNRHLLLDAPHFDAFDTCSASGLQDHKLTTQQQQPQPQRYVTVTLGSIPSTTCSNAVVTGGGSSCSNATTTAAALDHQPTYLSGSCYSSSNLIEFSAGSSNHGCDADRAMNIGQLIADLRISTVEKSSCQANAGGAVVLNENANNETCYNQQSGIEQLLANSDNVAGSLDLHTVPPSPDPDVCDTDAEMAILNKKGHKALTGFVAGLFSKEAEPTAEILPLSVPTTRQPSMVVQSNMASPVYRQTNTSSAGSSVERQPLSATRPGLALEDYGRAEMLERLKASFTAFNCSN